MKVTWLGRVNYADALAMQERIVAEKLAVPERDDELLLLEHEPVYTIGRTQNQSSLMGGTHLPHPIIETNRGGQATYHGPGQLIGYPIIALREGERDLHKYLRTLEERVIMVLAEFGVPGCRRELLTGVWVDRRKIASIGVGVRRWITMHGFALNVCGDLSPFHAITPCGIAGVEMTSIELETGNAIEVAEVASHAARLFNPQEWFSSGREAPAEQSAPARSSTAA